MTPKLRGLFHIHTRASFDSLLAPRKILHKARGQQADILVVTDHNTIRGSQEVAALAHGNPKHVICAGEYKTEKGDIIGMFLKEEILCRKAGEVIREIRRQGGLVLLPHPYKGHTLDDDFVRQMDLIETFNARCSSEENARAEELARKFAKPSLGGCDAHFAAEIGAVIMEFSASAPVTEEELRSVILRAPRDMSTAEVSRIYQPLSQMIKACKTRNALLFLSQAKKAASIVAHEFARR